MIKNYLLIAFTLQFNILFSQSAPKNSEDAKPAVYVIGSIHNMHFNSDNHYSMNDLLEQISILKPDLVCGEIAPEAYNQAMEGYFPPEAALLAEMATTLDYRFVPTDWRLDYYTQSLAGKEYPSKIKKQRKKSLDKLHYRLNNSDSASLYDDVNGKDFLSIIDSLYEEIIAKNTLAEIAAGSWQERNRRIVENGLAAMGKAKVVVFVFGVDHTPQIKRQLKVFGIDAETPKRMFTPGDKHKLPVEVINRWKRNLNKLELIRDKKIVFTYDNYLKVVNSKRIEDLKEAIEVSQ